MLYDICVFLLATFEQYNQTYHPFLHLYFPKEKKYIIKTR